MKNEWCICRSQYNRISHNRHEVASSGEPRREFMNLVRCRCMRNDRGKKTGPLVAVLNRDIPRNIIAIYPTA